MEVRYPCSRCGVLPEVRDYVLTYRETFIHFNLCSKCANRAVRKSWYIRARERYDKFKRDFNVRRRKRQFKWKYNQSKYIRILHAINPFRRLMLFFSSYEIRNKMIEISKIKDLEERLFEEERMHSLYPEAFKKQVKI